MYFYRALPVGHVNYKCVNTPQLSTWNSLVKCVHTNVTKYKAGFTFIDTFSALLQFALSTSIITVKINLFSVYSTGFRVASVASQSLVLLLTNCDFVFRSPRYCNQKCSSSISKFAGTVPERAAPGISFSESFVEGDELIVNFQSACVSQGKAKTVVIKGWPTSFSCYSFPVS